MIYEVLYQKYKNLPSFANKDDSEQISVQEPLSQFSQKELNELLNLQYFQLQRRIWRNQYDEERAKLVPVIICRVCAQKFYADRASKHSKFCIEKVQKLDEQKKIDSKFLQIGIKATETMLAITKLQQEEVAKCGADGPKGTVFGTPTL